MPGAEGVTAPGELRAPWQPELRRTLAAFRLPVGLTAASAGEEFGPGVSDPRSEVGLSKLARRYPETWHLIVGRLTPGPPRPRGVTRIDQLLTTAAVDQARPRTADDQTRLKRYRASARRISEAVGARNPREFDDERLEALRHELIGRQGRFPSQDAGAESVARDISLLRTVLSSWRRAAGLPPTVSRGPRGPRRRIGIRAPRPTATPELLAKLLPELDGAHRLACGFAGGAGLGEAEILKLRIVDIDPELGAVQVVGGGTRGRPGREALRWEPIASWAWDIVRVELSDVRRRDGDAFLFPCRADPSRPRSTLGRGLRKASERLFATSGTVVTLGSLRRMHQELLRRRGFPRAAVRSSWWIEPAPAGYTHSLPVWVGEQAALMRSWVRLCDPPGGLGESPRLPKSAPKDCGPLEPELQPQGTAVVRPSRRRPVPESCLVGADPTVRDVPENEQPAPQEPGTAAAGAPPSDPWGASEDHREHPELHEVSRLVGTDDLAPLLHPADLEYVADRILERIEGAGGERFPGGVEPYRSKPRPRIDASAMGRTFTAELPRALRPLDRRLAAIEQRLNRRPDRDRATTALVAGAAIGAGATWAATNPDEAREGLQRLGDYLYEEAEEDVQRMIEGLDTS